MSESKWQVLLLIIMLMFGATSLLGHAIVTIPRMRIPAPKLIRWGFKAFIALGFLSLATFYIIIAYNAPEIRSWIYSWYTQATLFLQVLAWTVLILLSIHYFSIRDRGLSKEETTRVTLQEFKNAWVVLRDIILFGAGLLGLFDQVLSVRRGYQVNSVLLILYAAMLGLPVVLRAVGASMAGNGNGHGSRPTGRDVRHIDMEE